MQTNCSEMDGDSKEPIASRQRSSQVLSEGEETNQSGCSKGVVECHQILRLLYFLHGDRGGYPLVSGEGDCNVGGRGERRTTSYLRFETSQVSCFDVVIKRSLDQAQGGLES